MNRVEPLICSCNHAPESFRIRSEYDYSIANSVAVPAPIRILLYPAKNRIRREYGNCHEFASASGEQYADRTWSDKGVYLVTGHQRQQLLANCHELSFTIGKTS